ncbi:SAM-dependent methyltransferase [Streptomyces kronopolitis]|nr:SAM-dependent methyltransferase [Streptomyces kronopolitis]
MDVSKPSVARMYDHLLGGTDNYFSDRLACDDLLRMAPSTRELALINRAFLIRSVRFLAAQCGVRRFIDFGSGLPTHPNVHEVAQEIDNTAQVVYVDNDPIVLAHGRMMLQEDMKTTAVIMSDMRDTERVFATDQVHRLLRDRLPVAALFASVLHCIPNNSTPDPWQLVRDVAKRLPPGSYLVISQLTSDDPKLREDVTRFMCDITEGNWGEVRSFHDVRRFFEGLELQEADEPCEVSQWRPDSQISPRQATQEWVEYGGVARIP